MATKMPGIIAVQMIKVMLVVIPYTLVKMKG